MAPDFADPAVAVASHRGVGPIRASGAWDFPLSSQEKTWRLTALFQQELDDLQGELAEQQQALRREPLGEVSRHHTCNGTCRDALESVDGPGLQSDAACAAKIASGPRTTSARCVAIVSLLVGLSLGVVVGATAMDVKVDHVARGCFMSYSSASGNALPMRLEEIEIVWDGNDVAEEVEHKVCSDVLVSAVEVTKVLPGAHETFQAVTGGSEAASLVELGLSLEVINDLPEAASAEQDALSDAPTDNRDEMATVTEQSSLGLPANLPGEPSIVQDEVSLEETPDDLEDTIVQDRTAFDVLAFTTGAASFQVIARYAL